LATSAARTVVGTDVGYHPSVLKPIVERVLASDLIYLDDFIDQLYLFIILRQYVFSYCMF
jgi:hypothetical protein